MHNKLSTKDLRAVLGTHRMHHGFFYSETERDFCLRSAKALRKQRSAGSAGIRRQPQDKRIDSQQDPQSNKGGTGGTGGTSSLALGQQRTDTAQLTSQAGCPIMMPIVGEDSAKDGAQALEEDDMSPNAAIQSN